MRRSGHAQDKKETQLHIYGVDSVMVLITSGCSLVTVSGILKGFDQLVNLVLDESKETIRGTCMAR